MKVSTQYAATHLNDILSTVESGEEVRIEHSNAGRRILGAGKGEVILPTDEEWDAMDEEIARDFNEGPLIPGETLEETMRWLPEAMAKAKIHPQSPLLKRAILKSDAGS